MRLAEILTNFFMQAEHDHSYRSLADFRWEYRDEERRGLVLQIDEGGCHDRN